MSYLFSSGDAKGWVGCVDDVLVPTTIFCTVNVTQDPFKRLGAEKNTCRKQVTMTASAPITRPRSHPDCRPDCLVCVRVKCNAKTCTYDARAAGGSLHDTAAAARYID